MQKKNIFEIKLIPSNVEKSSRKDLIFMPFKNSPQSHFLHDGISDIVITAVAIIPETRPLQIASRPVLIIL